MITEKTYEIYQAQDGSWRWRMHGRNGETVASGEGYTREADAMRGFRTMLRLALETVDDMLESAQKLIQ